jgi:hypothetical protein
MLAVCLSTNDAHSMVTIDICHVYLYVTLVPCIRQRPVHPDSSYSAFDDVSMCVYIYIHKLNAMYYAAN